MLRQGSESLYDFCIENNRERLLEEWDYEKNKDIAPKTITKYSSKKVWWKCKLEHEWQSTISNRTRGNNCPSCSKSSKYSFAEKAIFFYIKKVFKDAIDNYRPKWLEKLEMDIYIDSLKLAIEYDGSYYHNNKKSIKRDLKKEEILKKLDIKLIRVAEDNSKSYKKPINAENYFKIFTTGKNNSLNKSINNIFMFIKSNYSLSEDIINKIDNLDIDIDKDNIKILELMEFILIENSLAVKYPEIAKEWHPTKNGNLNPNQFSFGTDKKVWWKCKLGHEWKTSIAKRQDTNCPICSNQKILVGFNDLATTNPKIASEWNFEKNKDINPTEVTVGSNKNVWWKCSLGHEWKTKVSKRQETNCPVCTNQKTLTGFNDLATINPSLTKEWNYDKNKDLKPTDITAGSNKRVWWKCKLEHEWQSTVSSRHLSNSNCPICINKILKTGFNDLATTHPEIAKEWNYEKNKDLKPTDIIAGSNKKVWWKCEHNHEWKAIVISRQKSNCPVCSNKTVLEGFNDLATTDKALAREWNYEKNKNLKPTEVSRGSKKKVWWKCEHNHEWEAYISNRAMKKYGCPICSNQKVLAGFNDLKTTHPKIAKEWNFEKNNGLKPTQFTIGSAKKVWWKCNDCNEEYELAIEKKFKSVKCPKCKKKY